MYLAARPPSDVLRKKAVAKSPLRVSRAAARPPPIKESLAKPPSDLSDIMAKPPTAISKPPPAPAAAARPPIELEDEIIHRFRSIARPPSEIQKAKKAMAKPPKNLDPKKEAMARPPMDFLEEARSAPPLDLLCLAMPPSDVLEKSAARPPVELSPKIPSDDLFRSMRYFVVWYDQTYPYGEYSGYQEYLGELLTGVPMKIENSYQNALRQLNKSSANTKYILVATGRKKKKLVQEVHDNEAVDKIFIIKPFAEKILKWGGRLKKISALRDFKSLVEELKKLTTCYEPSGYKYDVKAKLISYTVQPNPMTMSEQSVRALQDELSQEEDQKRFRHQYGIALRIMKKYFQEQYKKYKEIGSEELKKNPMSPMGSPEQSWPLWLNLLDLSIYFDECPFIFSGAGIEELAAVNSDSSDLQEKFFLTAVNTLAEAIQREGKIDEQLHSKALKQLHKLLYLGAANDNENYSLNMKGDGLFLIKMLLQDLDLCLKSFIHIVLQNDETYNSFDYEFLHAAVVSDTRVSVLHELWEAWKDSSYSSTISLSDSELNKALEAITIKNVVILNTSRLLDGLKAFIKSPYSVHEYAIARDFVVDWENHAKLKYTFCYFIIEPSLTVSEYNVILNTCIQNAITPLFVLYLPSRDSKIAKEMFKSRWIVSFVYCYTFAQIVEYLKEKENNLNRDLAQYSKYYDNFKTTLNRSGESQPSSQKLSGDPKAETDAGWEVLSTIDKNVFSQLVEELSLGTKLVGSLHYYFLKELKGLRKQEVYWKNYAHLFGITEKYTSVLDVNCSKALLRAYTLQTNPAFYKMLNDAFRVGTEESVAKFRAFFSMLHDVVKKGILRKYIGFVYRGTYFNPKLISELKVGAKVHSTCFTSTSKSESVARAFARKTKRNVLLEIELDPHANSNVDIHAEQCSRYPEEEEVLLLPFSTFEIKRVFQEDNLTLLSLKEVVPEYELVNLKGIEYYNQDRYISFIISGFNKLCM
eukprot:TRINITY_DN415_c0_g1_i3.p1 TRINITY_DN415_c0_g1~~TRINITY_DN415_c0_g1_i3.p1  ORF type:complete len:980 (+),score=112.85 TRINITY_DN415_c0_g1_i3:156-3095(+)